MGLTTYLVGGSLALVALTVGIEEYRVLKRDKQIETAGTLIAVATHDKVKAEEASAANAAVVTRLKADAQAQAAIIAETARKSWLRQVELNKALKRINDAPKSDDGPLAPVLKRELVGVRPDGNGAPGTDGAGEKPDTGPDTPSPDLSTGTTTPGS